MQWIMSANSHCVFIISRGSAPGVATGHGRLLPERRRRRRP